MILKGRLAVAAILLPVLYGLIVFLPPFLFFLLAVAAILTAQYEFYRLYDRNGSTAIFLALILGFLLLCRFYFVFPLSFELLVSAILMILLIFQLFFFRNIQSSLPDSSALFISIFYPAGFLGYLIALRLLPDGVGLILFLLFVVWGGDAGAYYAGRSIGGKKLYPAVSPNKTVSGAIGGLLTSVLGGAIAKLLFSPSPFTWNETILLSLLLGGMGQLGDLSESLFKRSAGVKDSGAFVPSHGGIFDKLDGVAFSAPLLYYYLVFARG